MKTSLPKDPVQLQLMLQVAKSVSGQDTEATAETVEQSTAEALELLALDPIRAKQALDQIKQWQTQPAAEAERFLGQLSLETGLSKAGLAEGAVLSSLGALITQLQQGNAGLPPDVTLSAAEKSSTWDGQHARLAADFPRITLGKAETGTISLAQLLPKNVEFTVTDDLRQRIEQGVDPREHLHPGGIVASELVAQLAGLAPGKKVLDLCSGEGGVSRYFATAHGAHVSSYETSDAATAVAQRKASEEGLEGKVDIKGQSISKIDVPPESVDAVTGTDADGIHYVDDRQDLFNRVHDSLKPGGAFVFKAYVPGMRPEGVDEASWTEDKDRFTQMMGWDGEDKASTVRPEGINAEFYVEQLVASGFNPEDIEVIDLNSMYTEWQSTVADNQNARGHKDSWMDGWMELNNKTKGFGFVIRAKKAPASSANGLA